MALLQAEAAKEAALRAAQPAATTFALGFLSGAESVFARGEPHPSATSLRASKIRLSSDLSPVLAKR